MINKQTERNILGEDDDVDSNEASIDSQEDEENDITENLRRVPAEDENLSLSGSCKMFEFQIARSIEKNDVNWLFKMIASVKVNILENKESTTDNYRVFFSSNFLPLLTSNLALKNFFHDDNLMATSLS